MVGGFLEGSAKSRRKKVRRLRMAAMDVRHVCDSCHSDSPSVNLSDSCHVCPCQASWAAWLHHAKSMSLSSSGRLPFFSCVSLPGSLNRVHAKSMSVSSNGCLRLLRSHNLQCQSAWFSSCGSLPGSISVMFSTSSQVPILTLPS